MHKKTIRKKKTVTIEGVCVIRHKPQNDKWELDAGLKLGGTKKYRQTFATLDLAKVKAEQIKTKLKNEGIKGFSLTRDEQIDAEKALKLAKPIDVSLTDAVKFYVEHHQLKGAEMTFANLVDDYRSKLDDDRAKGEGVADRTYSDYKSRHNRLKSEFTNITLISFSYNDHWLSLSRQLGTASRRYENHLRILFNHAVEKEYIKSSPMKGKLSKAPSLKKPAILKEGEWRQLLLTAIETEEELGLLGFVILTLYMGLRPESEVMRITWRNINFKTGKLFISNEQTGKSHLGRRLEIPQNALDLLHMCKRKKGDIIESNYEHKKNWNNLRERAGFIVKNASGEIIRNDWVGDIARHTAGTMVYAKTQSKETVRTFLGHTNDDTMMHYVNHGESIDEEADRFYSFTAPLPNSNPKLSEKIA